MTNDIHTQHIPECKHCGDEYPTERWAIGYKWCLPCGEAQAKEARKSWCVVQEYTKGNYQFITQSSAAVALCDTNPKATRS